MTSTEALTAIASASAALVSMSPSRRNTHLSLALDSLKAALAWLPQGDADEAERLWLSPEQATVCIANAIRFIRDAAQDPD